MNIKKGFVLVLIALAALLSSSFAFADNDTLTIFDTKGKSHNISKKDYPVAYRCYEQTKDPEFLFSIRHNEKKRGYYNSWLIFPNYDAYLGTLYRNGLTWRFDWKDPLQMKDYSLTFNKNHKALYYQWSLANEKGIATGKDWANCKKI